MKSISIPIVGGTNPGRYNKISNESTYNMIVSGNALVPYSGYKKIKTIHNQYSSRALFSSNLGGFMVTVVGESVYKILLNSSVDDGLEIDKVGTIETTDGDVQIVENGNSEIGICDGFKFYVWNYSTGSFSTQNVQSSTPNAIAESLTYIFISIAEKNTFYYTNPNQMTDITSPNPIPAFPIENSGEIGSDKIVALHQFKDFIFVFGERHTKIWTDRGLAINPFQLDPTLVIEYGCLNKESVASGFGIMAWLAVSEDSNTTIVSTEGGEPKSIATDGIDFRLSQLEYPEDCSAFIFQEDGHIFYQMTWKSDNLTLVYDFTSEMFLNVTDENQDHHIAKKIVQFKGSYYFISFNDTSIYKMGSIYTTYDGKLIPRIRVTPPLRDPGYKYFKVSYLDVVAEQGTSNNPMYIDLSISKDGSRSFGNYIRKDMSRLGRKDGLIRFHKLGASRDFCFQFRFWGDYRFVILSSDAYIS